MPTVHYSWLRFPRSPGSPALSPLIVVVALIGWSADVRASAITYEYGGVITSAEPSSGISPGTRFSGTFTYDPKDLAEGVEIEGDRNYQFGRVPGFPSPAGTGVDGLTLSIGGQSIASLSSVLGVDLYEPALGGYTLISGQPLHETFLTIDNGGGSPGDPITVQLSLSNLGSTVYPSLAMPATINLADFTSATLNVSSDQPGGPSFTGTIDKLLALPTPAPEPSTVIVLGLGLAAWLARARFRTARRPS
jgi:hypothetical protein